MMVVLSLFVAITYAKPAEFDFIKVFKRAQALHRDFLKDTRNNRQRFESFEENEFIPAVRNMMEMVGSKSCANCLMDYLEALAVFEGSANETLTDQLKEVIARYPQALSVACTKTAQKTKALLKVNFRDAARFLAAEKGADLSAIHRSIASCM